VHEGGLRVQRAGDGVEFRRADGRAILRCGYRAEDSAPDSAVLKSFEYSSVEGWLAALVSGRNPHAGVREEAEVYAP
jgi:hypothetical protein